MMRQPVFMKKLVPTGDKTRKNILDNNAQMSCA
jgi:hypothetical protein